MTRFILRVLNDTPPADVPFIVSILVSLKRDSRGWTRWSGNIHKDQDSGFVKCPINHSISRGIDARFGHLGLPSGLDGFVCFNNTTWPNADC